MEPAQHTGITLYGAQWCADCKRSKDYLASKNIAYTYVDIESSADIIATVQRINGGQNRIPTIQFADGSVLVEPTNQELQARLDTLG